MIAEVSGSCVTSVLFNKEIPVSFAIDWKKSSDGTLSKEIMVQGISVLRSFMEECRSLSVPEVSRCAIATEVFRKASNGWEYLVSVREELGLEVDIVTQDMEAELGFRTAVALQGSAAQDIICWDSGGASFQITSRSAEGGGLRAFVGAFGTGTTTAQLVEKIQGASLAEKATPNPVSATEAASLIANLQQDLPHPAEWLQGQRVTAIGGPNSMFAVASEALGATRYSLTELQRVLATVVDCSDDDLLARPFCQGELREPPGLIVPKICLLTSVMEHCRMAEVHFTPCTGSCPGLLISEERYSPSQSAM